MKVDGMLSDMQVGPPGRRISWSIP